MDNLIEKPQSKTMKESNTIFWEIAEKTRNIRAKSGTSTEAIKELAIGISNKLQLLREHPKPELNKSPGQEKVDIYPTTFGLIINALSDLEAELLELNDIHEILVIVNNTLADLVGEC